MIGCGKRMASMKAIDNQWNVLWSKDGGTIKEGIACLVRIGVTVQTVTSVHHNELSLRISPQGARRAVTTPNDAYITGAYAPPDDERRQEAMAVLHSKARQRKGAVMFIGDFNCKEVDIVGMQKLDAVDEDMPTYIGDGMVCRQIDLALVNHKMNRHEPMLYKRGSAN